LSTADAGAGGLFVVDVVEEDDFDADRHPAKKQSAAMSTASILRVTGRRR
jgi:rhodanese-related sulfurtransferase